MRAYDMSGAHGGALCCNIHSGTWSMPGGGMRFDAFGAAPAGAAESGVGIRIGRGMHKEVQAR